MLLSPFIYYFVEFILLLVLYYDTLGFVVNYNRSKSTVDHSDYSRLLFTWILTAVITTFGCCLCCIPVLAEVLLLLKIGITLPVFNLSSKVLAKVTDENFTKSICGVFESSCGKPKEETNKKHE